MRLLRTSTRRTGRHAPAERTMRYCCRTCHSAPRASAREQTETQRRPTRTFARSTERTRSASSPAQSVESHCCTCHVACAAVVSGSRPTAERCAASSGRCESIRAWHAQPCESSRQHASTARPSSTYSMGYSAHSVPAYIDGRPSGGRRCRRSDGPAASTPVSSAWRTL